MKDLAKFVSRYTSVNGSDDQEAQLSGSQQQHQISGQPGKQYKAAALSASEKQRRKSLKAAQKMYPTHILSSFFNERQHASGARSPKRAFLLLTIGILAITTAVLVKIFHPYDLIFKWKLTLRDDGEIFNLWSKPPVDLYIKIYLFNITNPDEFLAGREKMKVQQVGPYVYKEIMTHENITFNGNNTVSTIPSHPLVWQEHLSEGHREDDQVVMLNIAMLAISHLMADKPFFLRIGLNTLFSTSNSQPLVRMTAKEFMFGFPSSLTTLGNTFLPNWIHFEKVGLIDRMYDFSTDYETFYTGYPDPKISGLYDSYLGRRDLQQWKGDHCSNIQYASDGTKFKSFLQKNESVKFFRKSMCRSIMLEPTGETEQHGHLSGQKYVFEKNAFDNGRNNEKNKCFCRNGYCQPVGLIDVTDCYYGFPISLSYPHFMEGDVGLQENITGLSPNPEDHSSQFIIQPESGLPLSLSAKVQINMHFHNLRNFNRVARFSHLTVPMLWFDITLPKLSDDLDSRFNMYLNVLPWVDSLGFWLPLLAGVVLLVFAVTRATLRMSNGLVPASDVLGGRKYGQANLRAATGAVYNPCEMKLIPARELEQSNFGLLSSTLEGVETISFSPKSARAPPLLERRESSYALELEPALSDDEDEEGQGTETATLSHNSTDSSLCLDMSDEVFATNSGMEECSSSCSAANGGGVQAQQTPTSYGSSESPATAATHAVAADTSRRQHQAARHLSEV